MKHVFWIHSSSTFAIACSVVEALKLQEQQVIFIFSRIAIIPNSYTSVEATNYFPLIYNNKLHLKFWKNWAKMRTFDLKVKALVNNITYKVYIPHSRTFECKLLTSHSLCSGYNYLEEGTMSYLSVYGRKANFYPYLFINFMGRFTSRPYFENKADKYFCVSDEAFPWVDEDSKVILDPVQVFVKEDKFQAYNNSLIICLDGLAYADLVAFDVYFWGLIRLLKHIKTLKGVYAKLIFKMHPSTPNKEEHKKFILELVSGFWNADDIEILSDSVSLESLIATCENVLVFTTSSSLSIYASLLGKPVINWTSLFGDKARHIIKMVGYEFLSSKSLPIQSVIAV